MSGQRLGISGRVAQYFLTNQLTPLLALAGMLLGLFNAFIAGYVSSTWADAFTFILLILILIVRPTGILGERVAEKV